MEKNDVGRAARGRRWWLALAAAVLVLVIGTLILAPRRTPGDQLTEAEIQAELARAGALRSAPTGLEDRPRPPVDIPPAE